MKPGIVTAARAGRARMALLTVVLVVVTALSVVSASPVLAKEGLAREKDIFDRLVLGAVVSEIYTKCDRIAPRKLRAFFFVMGTLNMARNRGYSKQDIDRFRSDPAQQKRLRREAEAVLKKHGVKFDDPESYCTAGFAEIEKKSDIGYYLQPE